MTLGLICAIALLTMATIGFVALITTAIIEHRRNAKRCPLNLR